nr:hypothetical protein [Tanacetum cinerariifolium]
MAKQKIVVRVTMENDKKSRKALRIAVSLDGVESASFVGSDRIAVTGEAAIRQFAYGSTADALDEYFIMARSIRQDLWIWHAFYGIAGANNDINVLDNFSLFDDLLDDLAHVVPYVVNEVEYRNGYYLADGIYPEWASFVKSFMVATDLKHSYFKHRQ